MNKPTCFHRAVGIAALSFSLIVPVFVAFQQGMETVERKTIATAESPTVVEQQPSAIPLLTQQPESPGSEQSSANAHQPNTTETGTDRRLGILSIRKKEIPVADNIDVTTLAKNPGWMPESALPGESGMCVIFGHRNRTHLQVLRDVKIGDSVLLTYADGREVMFVVEEIIVYEDTADWRLPTEDGDALVLVACWPFRYSGSAPGKWAVRCVGEMLNLNHL